MQTGDLKFRYDIAIISGFVRLNGKTIGNAASGATELADPSAQALFNYLWIKDGSLAVTPGGRGASGAADWAANKQIALPDWRGCALGALDDMGNSAAGRLTGTYFGAATTLGAMGGSQSHQMAVAEMAPHTHNFSGTTAGDSPDHSHAYTAPAVGPGTGTSPNYFSSSTVAANTGGASTRHTHLFSGSTDGGAGIANTPLSICQPTKLLTFYIKL
jgi:microcystin-dependent protein